MPCPEVILSSSPGSPKRKSCTGPRGSTLVKYWICVSPGARHHHLPARPLQLPETFSRNRTKLTSEGLQMGSYDGCLAACIPDAGGAVSGPLVLAPVNDAYLRSQGQTMVPLPWAPELSLSPPPFALLPGWALDTRTRCGLPRAEAKLVAGIGNRGAGCYAGSGKRCETCSVRAGCRECWFGCQPVAEGAWDRGLWTRSTAP